MNDSTTTAGIEQKPYLYEEALPPGLLRDLASFGGGPKPGEPVPEFDMLTTDGRRVRLEDFAGKRPLLITFASLTCPMTAASARPLKRLFEKHGRDVAFLSVYVREAFPGDHVPQARDRDEKLNFANRYKQRDQIPWPVAVDSLDGDFHVPMGGHPNACYVADERGSVAFRALWSSDEAAIDRALSRVAAGEPLGVVESKATAVAALAGLGCLDEALAEAGPQAQKRVLRKAAPIYGLGKLAGAFSPLPPAGRGAAALAVVGGAIAALAKIAAGVRRGRRQAERRF